MLAPDADRWVELLAEAGLEAATAAGADAERVTAAVVWQHPHGSLARYPHLGFIQSLGHGVDALLDDPELPSVPVARLVDPALADAIARWILRIVLRHTQRIDEYERLQSHHRWEPLAYRPPEHVTVGLLGVGEIGRTIADLVGGLGHPLVGWRRSATPVPGVEITPDLGDVVSRADVLVAALPSTPRTRGLLTAEVLSALPEGATFVNVGRGDLVTSADLLAALDAGHPAIAHLDVTDPEPLPPGSPLWDHPRVHVTPHVSGPTDPTTAGPVVVDNLRRYLDGDSPAHLVDVARGY